MMDNTSKPEMAALVDEIMEQAQIFASAYSLVGGRFDDGTKYQQSEDEKVELRRMIEAVIQPPAPQITGKADYCFDPDNWEVTVNWSDRDEVHGYGDALSRSEPMRVATLIKGPDKWVAEVPVTWDEHGDPDETEFKWFDSKEEARAAIDATEGSS